MKLLCRDNELQTMKGTIPSNPFLLVILFANRHLNGTFHDIYHYPFTPSSN